MVAEIAELRKLIDDGQLSRGILGGLPVPGPLRRLLPGGLSRQRATAITGGIGATSLAMMLMASATDHGRWAAVVGAPGWGWCAAAAAGVALERVVSVPDPGPRWPAAVSALAAAMTLIVVRPPSPLPARIRTRLQAHLRRYDCVLLVLGDWPEAAVRLSTDQPHWYGIRPEGRGRLMRRQLTIHAAHRSARRDSAVVWLPDRAGGIAEMAPTRPVAQWWSGSWGRWGRIRLVLEDAGVDGWVTVQDGPGATYRTVYHDHEYLAVGHLRSIVDQYPHLPWRDITGTLAEPGAPSAPLGGSARQVDGSPPGLISRTSAELGYGR